MTTAPSAGGVRSAIGERTRERRTVATRVLLSYAIVTLAFSIVVGWSVVAMRSAAREAVTMRSGYLPLALALRDSVAGQDVWNTQLNHVTAAKNPADQRVWFDLALRGGRPQAFAELRSALGRAFPPDDPGLAPVGGELLSEVTDTERFLDADRELVSRLFDALNQRAENRAEELRDQLVTRGHQARKRLSQLEQRVQKLVDSLIAEARSRERWAMTFLVILAAFTLVVGVGMAAYARRVLAPLALVTARAEAVAAGDLTPHPVAQSNDEIGELAATFEAMVAAIARANVELLAAERLATIGKMAAHVTHEIRNPLSSLALNVELLEEEPGQSTEASALLRAVKSEIDRLTTISERYLSVARRKPPKLEPEDVAEICRDALSFVKADLERHRVAATLSLEPDLPLASVDEGQLRQALHNLLRNAREAMPEGGPIELSARRSGDGIEIDVDDAGPGMDEATRAHLFEPFFTTKTHGTGLGLVITREIIEAHGGTLRCMPREPRGTRFSLYLPAAPARPRSDAPAPSSAEARTT